MKQKDTWILLAIIALFAIWKLSILEFRFGDENVYFYMTKAISDGLLPYRDFFIADPPFFIFLLTGFKALIGDHLILFKAWPVIFDSLSAVLIYKILRLKGFRLALLGPLFYLFSFTVLATSDYVTGAETTIFFVLAAVYASLKNKNAWSGVLWALACLCKLYAAPALIGFLAYKAYRREWNELRSVILGGAIATAIVLLPLIFVAPKELWYDLITHQFNRPEGLNKWSVFGFFATMEWILIGLGVIGAIISKHKSIVFQFALSLLFFLFYRDLYYLYLHILIPYLVILTVELIETIRNRFGNEAMGAVLALYILASLYPLIHFGTSTTKEGIFTNLNEVVSAIKELPKDYPLYGPQEVAPLAALMTGKKIFGNVIDTNTQNFAAKTHDIQKISEGAMDSGIYLITRGETLLYLDNALFKKHCIPYKQLRNFINIFECQRSNS